MWVCCGIVALNGFVMELPFGVCDLGIWLASVWWLAWVMVCFSVHGLVVWQGGCCFCSAFF